MFVLPFVQNKMFKKKSKSHFNFVNQDQETNNYLKSFKFFFHFLFLSQNSADNLLFHMFLYQYFKVFMFWKLFSLMTKYHVSTPIY